jgi:hypothetical protein
MKFRPKLAWRRVIWPCSENKDCDLTLGSQVFKSGTRSHQYLYCNVALGDLSFVRDSWDQNGNSLKSKCQFIQHIYEPELRVENSHHPHHLHLHLGHGRQLIIYEYSNMRWSGTSVAYFPTADYISSPAQYQGTMTLTFPQSMSQVYNGGARSPTSDGHLGPCKAWFSPSSAEGSICSASSSCMYWVIVRSRIHCSSGVGELGFYICLSYFT